MRRIALVQQKGGAAKTTLCVHLAVAAEQDARKTAIIDIDPQASASGVWGHARGDRPPPVAYVIAAELREALDAADSDGYEIVFVDTPPHTAPAIEVVARNIDLAVVPVQPSILDVAATQDTLGLLRANRVPAVAVITRAAARPDEETLETKQALAALGLPLLNTRVVERKVYRRALTQGQAVGEFEPASKAAKEDYGGSVAGAVAAEGGGAWAPEHGDLTAAAVVEAQGLGLLVLPWTVNTPARMLELAGWGIEGFITDRPDIGRNMLMRRPQPES